jgi:hypothetical protein
MRDTYSEFTTNVQSVANLVCYADLIIIEGFESVGKHAFMKKLVGALYRANADRDIPTDIRTYRPSYYTLGYSKMLDVKDRYVLRLPVIEAFVQARPLARRSQLIIDKAVFSDYVYMSNAGILTDQVIHDMFEAYHNQWKDLRIAIVHVTADPNYAQAIADSDEVQVKFESAYEYLKKFYEADVSFNKAFEQYIEMFYDDEILFIKFNNTLEIGDK